MPIVAGVTVDLRLHHWLRYMAVRHRPHHAPTLIAPPEQTATYNEEHRRFELILAVELHQQPGVPELLIWSWGTRWARSLPIARA